MSAINKDNRAGNTLPSEPCADEQEPTCHKVARQIGELDLGLARILSINKDKRAGKTLPSEGRSAEDHEKEFISLSVINKANRADKTLSSEGRSAEDLNLGFARILSINKRKAFSVLEILLVLIVIGILASLVLPKFGISKKQAYLSKTRSDIAAIRMGIMLYRNKTLLAGRATFPTALDTAPINQDDSSLFVGGDDNISILTYPIYSTSVLNKRPYSWTKVSEKSYSIWIPYKSTLQSVPFTYDKTKGIFSCDVKTYENCALLIK